MAFTDVTSPARPMSEADIEASRVYRKLDERGLIQMSALAHFADPSRTFREVREVPEPVVSSRSKTYAYSITSSAMARMPGGILRPSAWAVLRLMTKSNLLDCTTGRSAGFWPLSMRPT
jgi:hypothetical protein